MEYPKITIEVAKYLRSFDGIYMPDADEFAIHFYRLALNDVKKEIERRLHGRHCIYFNDEVEHGVGGKGSLLDFIEELKKL